MTPLCVCMLQISAYIASRNAKESDIHQFGLGQRKRRTSTRHARAPAAKKARSSNSSSNNSGGSGSGSGGGDTLAHDFNSTNRTSSTRRSDDASEYECDELAPSAGAIKANKSTITNTTTTTSSSKSTNNRGDNKSAAFEFNGFARVRQFNLERLFGIFGQVATICGVHMTNKPSTGSHSSVKGSVQVDHILTTSERASLHITDKSSSTSSTSSNTTATATASSSSSVVGSVCEGSSSSSVYDTMSVHMTMEEIARAYGSTHLFTMVSWLT